ncbi:hypothetical protein ScalyP_jg4024 [Parmales sp. scaly parma]|nr:hypothetical protein ScalyP_jg4024 [Parmales sp. scaly parma]
MAGNSTDDLFSFVKTPAPTQKDLQPKKPRDANNLGASPRLSAVDQIKQNLETMADDQQSISSNPFGTMDSNASAQALLSARIDYVCEQQIYYTKKLENERRRLYETDRRILRARTAILQRRKQISAVKDNSKAVSIATRAVAKCENKLNLILVKNNLTEKANITAKKNIENLRMEKMQQIKSTEKLNHQMRAKKAKITSLISETQTNQDKKDRVQREIELMKQKILDELEANTAEYEALKSELSLHQVGAGQTLKGGAAKTKKALELQVEHEMKGAEGNEGTLSQEEEQQIVSSINKAYWAIAKKKMDIQKQADKILELVDDFKFLSAQTGVKDVETLIPILLQSEEENFRLFDATNEYNKELESLEVERGAIRVDIAKFMRIETKQNEGKTSIKRELEDQIERAKVTSAKCDSKYSTDMEIIKKISNSVTNIFNKVGCDDEGLAASLHTSGVTDRNIMDYMAVIEQRIGEIVQLFNTTQKHGITALFEGLVEDPTRPITPLYDNKGKRMASLQQPTLPSHLDFEDVDGEDDEGEETTLEPMQISKMQEMVARDTRAARLGGRSKLSIGGHRSKTSNASLRNKGSSKYLGKGSSRNNLRGGSRTALAKM